MTSPDTRPFRRLGLVDLEAKFRQEQGTAVVLNYIDFTDPNYADRVNEVLYSEQGDMEFVASCDCGYRSSNFYIGATCPRCRTDVLPPLSFGRDSLPHAAWIAMPDDIPGVLHPVFYRVLAKWLTYDRDRNLIDILLDPLADAPPDLADCPRGFQAFHDLFDEILPILATFPRKQAQWPWIQTFVERYRPLAFVRHLPALSSVLHPVTRADETAAQSRTYTDKDSEHFLSAVHILSFLRFGSSRIRSEAQRDRKIHEAYKAYINYASGVVKKKLAEKTGLLRKHMFGARFHWSFRSVITPIAGPHRYDELYIPWSVAVNLLQVHIVGRLMNDHKHTLQDALHRHKAAETQHDEIISGIMNALIAESDWPGLPVLFNRNPSIQRGATQLLFVTKIKPDPADRSIALSVLILTKPNADFDGDSLNSLLLMESDAVRKFLAQHPSNYYLSTSEPAIDTAISLPKQPTINLAAFQGYV